MLENSYQRTTTVTHRRRGGLVHPASDHNALKTSTSCDIQTIQGQANAAATAAVNVAGYRRLVYVFPHLSACGFAGIPIRR